MKVYSSKHCPHCLEAKEILDKENIDYEIVEITGSMKALKEYLKLRDYRDEFDEKKESNQVGIPCFYFEDSSLSFDIGEAMEKARG